MNDHFTVMETSADNIINAAADAQKRFKCEFIIELGAAPEGNGLKRYLCFRHAWQAKQYLRGEK